MLDLFFYRDTVLEIHSTCCRINLLYCYYFNSVHNGEEMFDLDISDEFKSIVSISCKIEIFSLDIKHKIKDF